MSKDNRAQLGSSTDLKLKHAYHSNGVVLHGLGTQVRISSCQPNPPPGNHNKTCKHTTYWEMKEEKEKKETS
jgi:hypothetical protein